MLKVEEQIKIKINSFQLAYDSASQKDQHTKSYMYYQVLTRDRHK